MITMLSRCAELNPKDTNLVANTNLSGVYFLSVKVSVCVWCIHFLPSLPYFFQLIHSLQSNCNSNLMGENKMGIIIIQANPTQHHDTNSGNCRNITKRFIVARTKKLQVLELSWSKSVLLAFLLFSIPLSWDKLPSIPLSWIVFVFDKYSWNLLWQDGNRIIFNNKCHLREEPKPLQNCIFCSQEGEIKQKKNVFYKSRSFRSNRFCDFQVCN